MTKRAALPIVSAALLALSSQAHAYELSSADAFACGSLSGASANGWAAQSVSPDEETLRRTSAYRPDAASTVKLRIVYDKGNRVEVDHCGGTVISSEWIVTAGHCVAADRSWDRIEIIAGDQHLDGPSAIKRTARDAVCHAGFRYETLENDIALIHLDKPLPKRITPMGMDSQSAPSVRPGSQAQARGWPVTGVRSGDRMLNKVPLQVHNVEMRSYITATSMDPNAFGLCRGESGGPLVSQSGGARTLAGVLSGIQPGTANSYGDDCMRPGYEMYFTPIAAFRGWIDRVRQICDGNSASCSAMGSGMMLAGQQPSAPTQNYVSYAAQQPVYAAPTQPNYVNVGPIHGGGYMATAPAPVSYESAGMPTYVHTGAYYGGAPSYMEPMPAPMMQSYGFIPGHARAVID